MPKKLASLNSADAERQIMDVIYRLGRASAALVRRQLPDPPSYSAVRTLLTILERKASETRGSRAAIRVRPTNPITRLVAELHERRDDADNDAAQHGTPPSDCQYECDGEYVK